MNEKERTGADKDRQKERKGQGQDRKDKRKGQKKKGRTHQQVKDGKVKKETNGTER